MAAFAIGSVMTIMIIVLEMTTYATDVHHVIEWVLAMTVTATESRVATIQCEVGVVGMVKTRV